MRPFAPEESSKGHLSGSGEVHRRLGLCFSKATCWMNLAMCATHQHGDRNGVLDRVRVHGRRNIRADMEGVKAPISGPLRPVSVVLRAPRVRIPASPPRDLVNGRWNQLDASCACSLLAFNSRWTCPLTCGSGPKRLARTEKAPALPFANAREGKRISISQCRSEGWRASGRIPLHWASRSSRLCWTWISTRPENSLSSKTVAGE